MWKAPSADGLSGWALNHWLDHVFWTRHAETDQHKTALVLRTEIKNLFTLLLSFFSSPSRNKLYLFQIERSTKCKGLLHDITKWSHPPRGHNMNFVCCSDSCISYKDDRSCRLGKWMESAAERITKRESKRHEQTGRFLRSSEFLRRASNYECRGKSLKHLAHFCIKTNNRKMKSR